MATLATTRYVEVGTYIGQFFLPGAGTLPNEARVMCLVGRGDRNMMVRNNLLKRSFRYDEPLSLPAIAPFIAVLDYPADGNQAQPTSLRTGDGVEVSPNKWTFVEEGGIFQKILLMDSAFDPIAQYFLSYQSTSRDVLDPIPAISFQSLQTTAEVREIMALGALQDQQEYEEYKDFVGLNEIDPPAINPDNTNPTKSFSIVKSTAVGSGTVAVNSSALFSHDYSRLYTITCIEATGTDATRQAKFKWTATPISMGNSALPPVPLNPAEAAPEFTLHVPAIDGNTTPVSVMLELGVYLDFVFGVANFDVDDAFCLQANGPGLIEIDPLNLNQNQFSEFSAMAEAKVGTGSLAFASLPLDYAYTEHNLTFRLKAIEVTGTTTGGPGGTDNRTVTFVWSGYGTLLTTGTFTANILTPTHNTTGVTQTLGASGIKVFIDFGATHFTVGDWFSFTAHAPRLFYKGKEAVRNIKFTVGTVSYPAAGQAAVAGSFIADTPEGRYGNWLANTATNYGRFVLPDGLNFYVRNTLLSTNVTAPQGGSRLVTGDSFDLQARFLGVLDFSLLREETQTFSNPSEIATDVTGVVTGIVGARYVTTNNIPIEVISIEEVATGDAIAFTQVSGTPYLRITTADFGVSNGDLMVVYRWSGAEPAPGQNYYLTAKYLRPAIFYNRPFLFLSGTDSKAFLAPSTIRNDLYIGASIAYDYAVPGLFIIQVKDADDDGVYSKDDFKTAVKAFLQDRRATDLVVLNYFGVLPDQLQVINIANDPFELHESMTWIGTPIGTTIGSEQELGSMVYLSRRPLAVYGQSPAHGTRVLIGSTRATRTITLEDKSSTSVTLDGSFIAAAVGALQTSFSDPKETLLLKAITSFDTMQTHTDPENAILGGNNILFFANEGNGVYRLKEDITTDPFSPDTLNINQMIQKQFVTRDIRRTINSALLSLVFPSATAGVATLQAILTSRLSMLEGNNLIGKYQDAKGNVRGLNPKTDTLVFRDTADPTLFHIGYNYFLATTAKRVFGLFTVNLANGFPT